MEKTSNFTHIVIIILIIGSTILIMNSQKSQIIGGFPSQQRDTISVTGSYNLDVAPDQAEITIEINTEAQTAKEAQDLNTETSNKVISAIKSQGVAKDDIETINYNLNKRESYDPKTGKPTTLGYTQVHTLKVVVKDFDRIGDVIDAATDSGANRINNIFFSLSREKQIESNNQALKLAAENAREKAKALASSLNVGLGKAITISETNYNYNPIPYAMDKVFSAGAPEASQRTEILPGKVTVSLTVNVMFEIK